MTLTMPKSTFRHTLEPVPTQPGPLPADLADAELVARLLAGDQAALEALYDRHAAALYGLALRVVTDAGTAQEVVQEVFSTLWTRPERFDPARGELRAFLLTMTRSRGIDRLRRERATLPLQDEAGEVFPLPDPGPGPQARAEQAAGRDRLRAALTRLSAAHRETVERAYYRDESREQIAEAMQVPVGTVKSRLKYALDKLRASLGEGGWSE